MTIEPLDKTDSLIRSERRGLWLACLVIGVLLIALALGQMSDSRQALLTMLPMGIVFGAVWVVRAKKGIPSADVDAQRQSVEEDELRQLAMHRAYKTGFLALLAGLSAFVFLGTVVPSEWPAQTLAAVMVAFGAVIFLLVFLFCDRA